MHPSYRSSSVSPKTPFTKRKGFFDSNGSNDCDQEELVCWKNSQDVGSSPVLTANKHKSANHLVATPVRIVKRHASSPVLSCLKSERSRTKDLSRFERQLKEEPEDDQKAEPSSSVKEKRDDSFSLSSDEYMFDLGDEELLLVLKKIEEKEQLTQASKERKHETNTNQNEKTQAPAATSEFSLGIDDSFDDAIFNSIPLEELSKKCAKENITNVNIKFEPNGLSQIVPSKALPRCSSDSSISKNASTSENKPKSNTSFVRHSSLLNSKPSSSAQPVAKTAQKKIFTTHKFCTPAEIAEKKRLAQERLAATRLKEKLKINRK